MPYDRKPERAVGSALQAALDASGFVGTWETDLAKGLVYPSGPLAGLVGIDGMRAALGVPLATFLEGVHPDDRERIAERIHEAHVTAGRFEAEFRTLGLDNAIHWISARGQVETDPAGRGLRCIGVAVDVTDTRQAQFANADQSVEIVSRVVDAMITARSSIETLGTPVLKTLIDVMLLELGGELTRRMGQSEERPLH